MIKYGIKAVCPKPMMSVASCIPEAYCYYEHYNDQKQYAICTWHVLQCIIKETIGITSCLYDLGGDVFIEWYKHGTYIKDYDYFEIALDVLECAGVDEWTWNYIKKTFRG